MLTPGTFEVSATNECIVCFDNAISTVLRPCGHIALCSGCAYRLLHCGCPVCRVTVCQVEGLVIGVRRASITVSGD